MSNGMIYMQWYDISTDHHTQNKTPGAFIRAICCKNIAAILQP
jgi:hypothetical protein